MGSSGAAAALTDRADGRAGRGAVPPGLVLPRYLLEGSGAAQLPSAGGSAPPRNAAGPLQRAPGEGTVQHRCRSDVCVPRLILDPNAQCFTSLLDLFQCISTTKQRARDFASSLTAAFSINRVPTKNATTTPRTAADANVLKDTQQWENLVKGSIAVPKLRALK